MQRTPSPPIIAFLLYPLFYYLGAKLSFSFTTTPEGAVILWLPNAVFLATLLYYQGQRYWLFALLTILAEVIGDLSFFNWKQAIALGLTNIAEVSAAFIMMRQLGMSLSMSRLQDLGKFVIAGPLFGSLLGGLLGGLCLVFWMHDSESYLSIVRIWWFGDGLGLILFTPLILLALQSEVSATHFRATLIDWLVASLGFILLGLMLLVHQGWLDFAITPILFLPCVLYFAARTSLFWTALLVASVSMATAIMITRGVQPFGEVNVYLEIIRCQEFTLILSAMSMGLCVLLKQIRSHEQELEARVLERTKALEKLNRQLGNLAKTDELTGLSNRRAFFERSETEFARCSRYERPLTLIMLDVDHFKLINDQYGHAIGDGVLRHIANIFSETARASDTTARYGGEEFVFLAPETDRAAGQLLAERLRDRLRQEPTVIDGIEYPVTVSMGLAFLAGQTSLEKLLLEADNALYQAKANGRDRIEMAD